MAYKSGLMLCILTHFLWHHFLEKGRLVTPEFLFAEQWKLFLFYCIVLYSILTDNELDLIGFFHYSASSVSGKKKKTSLAQLECLQPVNKTSTDD